jgi:CBS-domain-containing membrane protein
MVRLSQAEAAVGIVEESGRPIGLVSMADLMEPLLRGDDA